MTNECVYIATGGIDDTSDADNVRYVIVTRDYLTSNMDNEQASYFMKQEIAAVVGSVFS